ncbi:MAG: hypothetical protein KGI52_12855 [Burkholderiales bacterium]|nr:hypothetical protein [Burkholderiales bacterium]
MTHPQPQPKPHPHSELIIAWATRRALGEVTAGWWACQLNFQGAWIDTDPEAGPFPWRSDAQYRIIPTPKHPLEKPSIALDEGRGTVHRQAAELGAHGGKDDYFNRARWQHTLCPWPENSALGEIWLRYYEIGWRAAHSETMEEAYQSRTLDSQEQRDRELINRISALIAKHGLTVKFGVSP